MTDDPNRLRRYALEVMGDLPHGYSDALAVLDLVRELVEWREGGKPPSGRVVRLVGSDDPPAA